MNSKEIDALIKDHYSGLEVKPILDGIINEDLYNKASYKILWLLKEPYDLGDGKGGWDLREGINKEPDVYAKYKTLKNISIVTSSILNNQSYDEVDKVNAPQILKQIAYINVSKLPGGTQSKYPELENYYKQNESILQEQIKYCDPDIIIGGSVLYLYLNTFNLKWEEADPLHEMARSYFMKNGKLFIDAYHPSQITISEQKYCDGIKKVFDHWLQNKK